MLVSRPSFIAGAAASFSAIPLVSSAQAVTNLKIILFPGLATWTIWAGQQQGFYERERLSVALTPTPGSVYQFQHLSAGEFDFAFTAFDNLVAYDEGQGEVTLEHPADFTCVVGGDSGFLSLYVRPEIRTFEDLRGKQLVVDAINTGFSFVMRKILSLHGLGNDDYKLVPVGNTQARMEKMLSGPDYVGGMLTPPLDTVADARGLKVLARATDALGGHYQANCGIASKAWLARNGEVMTRFIRAHIRADDWLMTPANRDAAVRILIDNAKVTPQAATGIYAKMMDPVNGFTPKARIDVPGIQTALNLRAQYGVPKKTLGPPSKYYDDRYYQQALRS
ncbi:MAG TPA: ABC transporter substrate-binding protein [Candidatus Acidoferrales bacterium]|jgi:ABC-type nitrate/sulfonate/bicarbonate transport system substrate-binding protein|nr:ABC transporter substrate-binding protein [Candidatus Acidoferrales bacterium]